MNRTLSSVGVALVALAVPALAAATGVAAPSSASAPAPAAVAAEPPFVLESAKTVDVYRYDGYIYDDLGVRLTAGSRPFEVRSYRPSYDQEILTQWQSPDGPKSLPAGTVKVWDGLPRFVTLTLVDRDGKTVYERTRRVCLNGGAERMRPDAPARSPYPWGCPVSPWTKGSVQGVQSGWSIPLVQGYGLKLPFGRYRASVTVGPRYVRMLGLTPEQATHAWPLRVLRPAPGDFGFRKRERSSTLARPAASEPTEASGGTVAGPVPDLQSLPAFDMSIGSGGNYLRFSATVWNAGDSPLVVDGFRRPGEEVMDAYQYFFDTDGNQTGYQQVGEMEWHAANHNHWHFHDFARYRLLKADRTTAVRSKKESFCLANTDAVDYTVPGADWRPENTDLSSACGGRGTLSLREVLSSGSGDTYAQYRAGQSFNLKGLPNGRYYVAVEANPVHHLVESDTTNNVSLRRVWIGGREGHRTVAMAQVGIIAGF
jgi:hypothetical protein